MPALTITRSNQYINSFRKIDVYMDNKKLGALSNAETQTFSVEEGTHTFFAQGDWITSKPVTLSFDQVTHKKMELGSPYKATPYSKGISVLFVVFLLVLVITGSKIPQLYMFLVLFTLLCIQLVERVLTKNKSMFYYMTVGRRELLYLSEVK